MTTLNQLADNEEDPVFLWDEIHRLRAAVQGPKGYATWQEAATDERIRRVKAERQQLTHGWVLDRAVDRLMLIRFPEGVSPEAARDCCIRSIERLKYDLEVR